MKLFFSNRCYNGGNHHKFEPRFDEIPSPRNITGFQYDNVIHARRILVLDKYIHDICIWCGKKILPYQNLKENL